MFESNRLAEVWIHRPGQNLMSRHNAPIGEPIVMDITLKTPGRIHLSNAQINALVIGREAIIRISPFCHIIYCKDIDSLKFRNENGDNVSLCGLVVYSQMVTEFEYTEPTIFIPLIVDYPSIIRSSSHHEAFHACEPLLSDVEKSCLDDWGRSLSRIELPPFVVRREKFTWWNFAYERVAWSFENFCYIHCDDWIDDLLVQDRGFIEDADFFPDDVFDVFWKVWCGEVGKRMDGHPSPFSCPEGAGTVLIAA